MEIQSVLFLIVCAIVILGSFLLGWKLGSEKKDLTFYLRPKSGGLKYYGAVNQDGDLTPYTPNGKPWKRNTAKGLAPPEKLKKLAELIEQSGIPISDLTIAIKDSPALHDIDHSYKQSNSTTEKYV